MAKVSHINNHDYVRLNVTFPDKSKANVTWSRGGETVTVDPNDPARAERLSLIVAQSLARTKDKVNYPYRTIGELVKVMEPVAKSATTMDQYLDGLAEALMVSGERPKPKAAAVEGGKTLVNMKPGRGGYQIDARFPNGERFSLKLNKSSVGFMGDPAISSRDNEVMHYLLNLKGMGVIGHDELAQLIKEKAESAQDIDGWLADVRAEFAPAPRR